MDEGPKGSIAYEAGCARLLCELEADIMKLNAMTANLADKFTTAQAGLSSTRVSVIISAVPHQEVIDRGKQKMFNHHVTIVPAETAR
eukprot:5423141-Amphidinium_carterae.1